MMCLEDKLVGARSLLALDFLTVIDAFTRNVTDVIDELAPLSVDVRGEAKVQRIDYAIFHKDGQRDLVLVWTVSWLMQRTRELGVTPREFIDAMTSAARRIGFGFRLETEDDIRVQPRLSNAIMLRRHLVGYGEKDRKLFAIDALAQLPKESSVAALQEQVGSRFDAFALALQLDWLGHIKMDGRTAFSRRSTFVKT
ncbi:hypothetical protein SR870_06265 [Rhodopseudomonas palustris]|uniref:hypothetical protein n=1 Tax=Rhodopseudomonas palustris TaxID=1076 RepID=UPI002ACE7BDC|nr:hypothetical protein [Rhodopseudomonas palustris]WQH00882.1 hypothetical protein SR870_06265 [Rhodopseudomonas palustris]